MRDLDQFQYMVKFIDNRINDKMLDCVSHIVTVNKTDGFCVDCELVKSINGITILKNIPIVQSNKFHYNVKKDDYGLLLNIGMIPSNFFLSGDITNDVILSPSFVFLPLIPKIYSHQLNDHNALFSTDKNNIVLDDEYGVDISAQDGEIYLSNNTNSINFNNDTEIKTDNNMKLSSQKDLTINSDTGITLKSNEPMDLNGSDIASFLQKLLQVLTSISPLPTPPNSVDPTWATLITQLNSLNSDLSKIVSKLK